MKRDNQASTEMDTMRSQIMSREIIKPSSPTPPHLKIFHLSLLDRSIDSSYVSFAFFFSSPSKTRNVLSNLRRSLSSTLAKYYPFAGRLANNGSIINCNDEGIEFFEGQMHCKLYEILDNPGDEIQNHIFPCDFLGSKATQSTSLLAVQVTSFQCGGITVSLCISHKIGDGFSMVTFINDWAKVSRGERICPDFIAMSMEPMGESSAREHQIHKDNRASARFMFSSSSLSDLKTRCTSSGLTDPTRVESVTALLYKTAVSAARSQSGVSSNSFLHQGVNMRSRLCELPFSENSIGNFIWGFAISSEKDDEKNLKELAKQLREGKVSYCTTNGQRVRFNEWISGINQTIKMWNKVSSGSGTVDNSRVHTCTSLCRFPFYDVDYGWGKPILVKRDRGAGSKNLFALMDFKDGQGIEALVTLDKDDMEIFKHDKELLTFASLSPSVS